MKWELNMLEAIKKEYPDAFILVTPTDSYIIYNSIEDIMKRNYIEIIISPPDHLLYKKKETI